jgi:hemolysin-activating ACP:hemolysin acyltransferase|tara:strand:- start:41 stop:478 length:438 start_codon:yes stop_codon:yes gene_type:complete
MNFIFNKNTLEDMQSAISLYKKFDKYNEYSREDIYYHLLPSFKLKQYKIHKDGDMIIGFTNWAFLSKDAEKKFTNTGFIGDKDWNSGNQLWHVDTICVKQLNKIMSWTKQYFTKKLGINKPINWLRVSDNKIIRKQTIFTKGSWA